MKTMTKALCCAVLACGGAAMAAGTLRWTPVFRPMPIEVRPVQGKSINVPRLNSESDDDLVRLESLRQLLCNVWRMLLGCTEAPGKLPECCGGDWTGDTADGGMLSVMSFYATSGVPTGLSSAEIKDLLDAANALKSALTGTLPTEVDPSIAAAMVDMLNKIIEVLGG